MIQKNRKNGNASHCIVVQFQTLFIMEKIDNYLLSCLTSVICLVEIS